MTVIFNTALGKYRKPQAPRMEPMALRKLLRGRFGRRIFCRRRQDTNITDVYVANRAFLGEVAQIAAQYEDLYHGKDAQVFNIIPGYPPEHYAQT